MPGCIASVPVHEGEWGNPVVIARALFPDIARLSGDAGARKLLAGRADEVIEVPVGDDAVVVDIDTPEALDLLRTDTARPGLTAAATACAGSSRLKLGAGSLVPRHSAGPVSPRCHCRRSVAMAEPILIFGGTGGIGSAIAAALRSKGQAVHLVARERGRLAELAGRIGATMQRRRRGGRRVDRQGGGGGGVAWAAAR